ncbi:MULTISPECIES: Crp/Fnr family transcriptional regulator [Alteromonas]|uniref:Crp/Fnr family transcriptional regulator n=2 Tax=Alteromonas stellipolaris TaxID=233316 RepID=A0AAW7Z0L9_9ALTE|nr:MULTISPECIES: Crp/Fnr family transcriptional regulator [Alteromonas]ALM90115.1 cAMP-binding protein [Alteromonas stellipolaris LMG 21856]MDO6534579.1 Crp/Fnr family transcriptional regulator [Alteromonas stellipolaris]MDO6539220.1 Crp/Fnr family transcriptional regulator [Alteromonas stellipolaris]MDO6577250.1 Crp/Fnr family transcriptional regulator [Alteromonas stellipolaris]MDO6626456.1 Crp/Fnr family transcriptional regulator [Alteromonas stellipolaris]
MKKESFEALKVVMESYAPLSNETWDNFSNLCKVRTLKKGALLYEAGKHPKSFAFVVKGLVRGYVINEQGQEYNKNFFVEGQFPGSMTALLTSQPSRLAFETVEDSLLVEIDFAGFRQLLFSNNELMKYQIIYLEKNWLLHKDAREIELVQDNATLRYQQFTSEFPNLADRLPLYQIASHLGVTPTQLSRIRKSLNNEK